MNLHCKKKRNQSKISPNKLIMLLAKYFLSAFTHTEKVKRSLQKKAIDMMHSFLSAALGDVDVAAFGASRSDAVSSSSASAA